jgi:hypothetical protein
MSVQNVSYTVAVVFFVHLVVQTVNNLIVCVGQGSLPDTTYIWSGIQSSTPLQAQTDEVSIVIIERMLNEYYISK